MISGNGYDGLDFQNAYENVVSGNLIGTDATGSYAVANGWGNDSDGIELEQGSSEQHDRRHGLGSGQCDLGQYQRRR